MLTSDGELNGDGSNFEPWIPIGRVYPSYFFCGAFDGNGHTISGLYCNRPESDNVGFFGVLLGNVKNLTITDSYFCGDIAGGIAARGFGTYVPETIPTSILNYYKSRPNTSITRCVNKATVIGEDTCGGIVGTFNQKEKISECLNLGKIFGYDCVIGGIAGFSAETVISCCNLATVSCGYGNVGGIVGTLSGGSIYNCLNKGAVRSISENFPRVGGICGGAYASDEITNNVNISVNIDAPNMENLGAIGGYFSSSIEIKYNYYLFVSHLRPVGRYENKASVYNNSSLTEDELKSSDLLSKLNAKASSSWGKWKKGKDGYPVLDWME